MIPTNRLTSDSPQVMAIIPIHNGKDDTLTFLQSFSGVIYPNLKTVVIDDGSTDGSAEAINKFFPQVTVLTGDGNLWWTGATNLGVVEALRTSSDFVLTINNDNEVDPGFLSSLVTTAGNNPKSIVTSLIYDYNDRTRLCSAGSEIRWFQGEIRCRTSRGESCQSPQAVDCLNGTSTLIPVSVFRECGLFDAEHCPQYHGDAELFLRAKTKGYRLLVDTNSLIYNKSVVSGGNASLNRAGLRDIIFGIKSPFYLKANYRIYSEYCPYRPKVLFLAVRYLRLLYSLLHRRFIDKTRGS